MPCTLMPISRLSRHYEARGFGPRDTRIPEALFAVVALAGKILRQLLKARYKDTTAYNVTGARQSAWVRGVVTAPTSIVDRLEKGYRHCSSRMTPKTETTFPQRTITMSHQLRDISVDDHVCAIRIIGQARKHSICRTTYWWYLI